MRTRGRVTERRAKAAAAPRLPRRRAGSAATACRRSSRPARSRSRPSPTLARDGGRGRASSRPRRELVSTLDDLLDHGRRRRGDRHPERACTPSSRSGRSERGAAVFCQKPLGRTAAEAQAVVDAARAADRLLARRPLLPLHRGHAPHPRARPRRRARARSTPSTSSSTTPTGRTSPGSTTRRCPAAAASWTSASTSSTSRCGRWTSPRSPASPAKLFAAGEPLGPATRRVEDYAVADARARDGGRRCGSPAPGACRRAAMPIISAAFYGTGRRGGAPQRRRLVLRFHRRALPRHRTRDARRSAGRVGRARGGGLGDAPCRRRALRPRGRAAGRRRPGAGPDLRR